MIKRFVFFAALLLQALHVAAQQFPMLRYGVEDGLPSNTVYNIYRDSKGFLWIGTDKGVARYNGIKFEVFSSANGLPDKEVFFFAEDGYGRLWLATLNGELCYYQDGVFHHRKNTPFLDIKGRFSDIIFINAEKDSSATICFAHCSRVLNIKKNTVHQIDLVNEYNRAYLDRDKTKKDGHGEDRIHGLSHLRKAQRNDRGGYHIEGENFVFETDDNGRILTIADLPLQNCCFTQGRHITFDSAGIYGFDKPYLFKKRSNGIYLSFDGTNVSQVYYDGINYFISTTENLRIADSGVIFNKAKISGVAQDLIGNYWVSTLDSGIFCFNKYFGKQSLTRNAYSGKATYSCIRKGIPIFANDRSTLFCIDNGGIKQLFSYSKDPDESPMLGSPLAYYITDSLDVYFGGGYYVHRIKNILTGRGRLQTLRHDERFGVKEMLVTNEHFYMQIHNAIIGCPVGLFDSGLFNFKKYFVSDSPSSRVFRMSLAPDGSIWYTKIGGTFRLIAGKAYAQKQFDQYTLRQIAFAGDHMVSTTQDNRLLICTSYNTKPAISWVPDQDCVWDRMYKIDSTHILISTNNYYRIITLKRSYGRSNYTITTVENALVPGDAESICGDGKNCYFFKNGNVYTFDLPSLLIRTEPPKLYLDNIRTQQGNYLIGPVVTIPYKAGQNAEISVTAISFRAKQVFYEYSVSKGGQDVWQPMQGNVLNLVDPGYGTYTVKVKARTSSSDYCKPVSFILQIPTPWWATWWFISSSILVLLTTTVLLVMYRLRRVLRRKEQAHEAKVKFMRSEYKALNALMNPHFIFNTINNLQTLVNTDDKRSANKYLVIFAELIRQNMHNVSKEMISLQKEMDLVTNYLRLEKLRFEKLNYTITIGKEVDLSDIMVPPMLIQPLVENSIKHGILPLKSREGHLYITISEEGEQLHIEIRDNGVGLTPKADSGIHESYGLSNIRERIRQLNAIQNSELFFDMQEVKHETTGEHLWTTVTIKLTLS